MAGKRDTKNVKKVLSNIRELTGWSTGSLKIRRITIHEKDGSVDIRPNIHVLFQASTGSFKSTLLNFIKRNYPSMSVDSMTVPGMIGTIEKMMLVPGAAWLGRNKLLLFDEFSLGRRHEAAVVYLKLLEDQFYSKKFGRFIPDRERECDEDLYYDVKNGSITMKTRFSAVIATMKRLEAMRGANIYALVNRCLGYSFSFTREEIDWVLEHTKLFDCKRYDPEPVQEVSWKKYSRIKRMVSRAVDGSTYSDYVKLDNYARLVGDAVRIYCVTGKLLKRDVDNIVKWKLDVYAKIGAYYRNDNLKKKEPRK